MMSGASSPPQHTATRSAAPQLVFDDGSRAIAENTASPKLQGGRSSHISIRDYYEIDRLVAQLQALSPHKRVALQFPDELLSDAPEVCWEFEQELGKDVLVFCLGDTTFAPCCPDQVAAAHLQADCLVHYGHACFSSRCDIPVLYSFGKQELLVDECVQAVVEAAQKEKVEQLLLLYQVQYEHAINHLQVRICEQVNMQVLAGKIPRSTKSSDRSSCSRPECCTHVDTKEASALVDAEQDSGEKLAQESREFVVGGLDIPKDVDLSDFTLLFVGSDTSRQHLNIVFRFLSGSAGPKRFWTWDPRQGKLSTDLSSAFQRRLSRRYYLVQKARQCAVFGILVANLSDNHLQTVVASLRQLLEQKGRTSYVFVVGKINPAKLANFAEIDCFVLVACPEHSLLEDDREYSVPVLTPLELSMALGDTEWGSVPYSLDKQDYLAMASVSAEAANVDKQDDKGSNDDDAPYFSLVTGRYESLPARQEKNELDLSILPGQGQLTAYNSAAADFLKQREYQGLQVEAGTTEVRAAVQGQQGIASNYSDR